jgi:hypothetical protein
VRQPATGEIAILSGVLDVETPAPLAYAVSYLGSCTGSAGPVTLLPIGTPSLGNAGFGVTVSGTIGGQTGYMLLATRPDALPVLPGCLAAVDLGALLVPFPGIAIPLNVAATLIPTPIPANASLSGTELFVQMVVLDPFAPAGVGLSNGLALLLR